MKDIFSDTSLSPYLGFKGGTAALMFYNLTRNSVDIDLDLLDETMQVMVKEDMFANKLMAMYERIGKTSRDVYDVYFFAKNNWSINRKLVEDRAQMPFKDVLVKCAELLEKMDNRHILDGLGKMLTEPEKDWARAKLRTETIFLLKAWLESEK